MRQAAVLIFMRSFTISSKRDQIHSLHPTSATILLNETKKFKSGIQVRVSRGHLLHAGRGTSASVYSRNDRSYNDEAIGREKIAVGYQFQADVSLNCEILPSKKPRDRIREGGRRAGNKAHKICGWDTSSRSLLLGSKSCPCLISP